MRRLRLLTCHSCLHYVLHFSFLHGGTADSHPPRPRCVGKGARLRSPPPLLALNDPPAGSPTGHWFQLRGCSLALAPSATPSSSPQGHFLTPLPLQGSPFGADRLYLKLWRNSALASCLGSKLPRLVSLGSAAALPPLVLHTTPSLQVCGPSRMGRELGCGSSPTCRLFTLRRGVTSAAAPRGEQPFKSRALRPTPFPSTRPRYRQAPGRSRNLRQ